VFAGKANPALHRNIATFPNAPRTKDVAMKNRSVIPAAIPATLSTEEAAQALGVAAQTLRKQMCVAGHYAGLRPVKLPNRFLRWPAEGVHPPAARRDDH
jgi:hypothetical protein